MDPVLYHAHHSRYQNDLPFWISQTQNRDPVLELGCGTGRVALPLARQGCRVWGLDHDPEMLRLARNLLAGEPEAVRERITLVEADMVSWNANLRFGSAVSACNTLSTLPSRSRHRLFENLIEFVEPAGRFAFSVPNPPRLAELAEEDGAVEEAAFRHPGSGLPVIVSSRITREGDRIGWVWIYDVLHPEGKVTRQTVKSLHTGASRKDYHQELRAAGWEIREEYGDFDGCAYQVDSPYLIMTAAPARSIG